MINEEIYILTKHARFQADYIESIPVYRRRYYLHLLQDENERMEKEREKLEEKSAKGRF